LALNKEKSGISKHLKTQISQKGLSIKNEERKARITASSRSNGVALSQKRDKKTATILRWKN
jgi:hypothetical protein